MRQDGKDGAVVRIDGTTVAIGVGGPADWLALAVDYEREHTWRTFHLFDPHGAMRASHLDCYNARTIVVHREAALSSDLTVPGAIGAGEWRLEFVDGFAPTKETFALTARYGCGPLPEGIAAPTGDREFWTGAVGGDKGYGADRAGGDAVRADEPAIDGVDAEASNDGTGVGDAACAGEPAIDGVDAVAADNGPSDCNAARSSEPAISAGGGFRSRSSLVGAAGYELTHYDRQAGREEGRRWYKGDFHTHTVLSDGKMTPVRNMEQAAVMGLDFFVATDHNLFPTGWPKGKTLVIPGIEFTSDRGHWNALGLHRWIDWRYRAPDGGIGTQEGMNRVMAEAGRHGALRSINHPMLVPWAWMYGETPLAELDAIEIWNDPTYHANPAATEQALKLWSACWNAGWRIAGIGGSDSHMLPTESYGEGNPPSLIGDPATYVYAERLSAESILAAVKARRVYVSRGPQLDIAAVAGERVYPPGSDLTEAARSSAGGDAVRCRVAVAGLSDGLLHVIENGEEIAVCAVTDKTRTFESRLDWTGADYVWRRFELRRHSGELLAFGNPFHCGAKRPDIAVWKELLAQAALKAPDNLTPE